ncbi:hypothetical protein AMJ49_02905 [Parcubacteria bacterium DG_74_2]|nr:MAG: hypothetical protein AMJ49_02905 [Parcubacteria bacterium DG_74_2]
MEKHISLKKAAKIFGYSSDYLGYLIRKGEIKGKKIFSRPSLQTTKEAILEYKNKTKKGDRTKIKSEVKQWISLEEATRISSYHPDYVGWLIRKGKIIGRKIYSDYSWLTTKDEIKNYKIKLERTKPRFVRLHLLLNKIFSFSWRFIVTAFLISILVSEFAPGKFFQAAIANIIGKEIKTINLYSNLVNGDWQNPQNAKGLPDTGSDADFNLFSESNSAVYKNGSLNLVLEKFSTDEAFENYNFQSAKIKFSFAIGEKEPDLELQLSTTTVEIQKQNSPPVAESQEIIINQNSSTTIFLNAKDLDGDSLTYSIVSGPEHGILIWDSLPEVIYKPDENYFGEDGFIFKASDEHIDSNEAEVEIIIQEIKEEIPMEETTTTIPETTTSETTTPEESTTTEKGIIGFLKKIKNFFVDLGEKLVTIVRKLVKRTIKLAEAEELTGTDEVSTDTISNLDAKIIIWWSLDGENWQKLKTISDIPLSNKLNGGYFEIETPFLKSFDDVKNLKIKFEGVVGGETNLVSYLDSVWIEVEYQQQAISEEQQEESLPGGGAGGGGGGEITPITETTITEEITTTTEATTTETTTTTTIVATTTEPTELTITEATTTTATTTVTITETTTTEVTTTEATTTEEKIEKKGEIKPLSQKRDFELNEEPEFKFKYKRFSTSSGSIWENINVTANLKNFGGEILETSPDLILGDDGVISIKLKKLRGFKPGLYKILLSIGEDGQTQEFEQDFTWGVLTINTNKSVYLPNETAYLQMAALKDDGHTICDANLKLEIISSSGNVSYPEIQKSGECGPDNVTQKPDYFAYYQVEETGVYQMKFTNLDTGHEISNSFEVREWVPFDVERIGPTRIWPMATYEMVLKIKTNQDFKGEVIEKTPLGFSIENIEYRANGELLNSKSYLLNSLDTQEIIWDVAWKEGESYELKYQFDAPDVSPYLYLLGPLQIDKFQEARQWQIAADALITKSPGADTGAWANPTNAYASNDTYADSSTGKNMVHTWYNYGFSLTGSSITKVEVGIEGYGGDSANYITIACSWDGGTSWTSEKSYLLPASDPGTPTYIDLTDGRTWTPDELSDANFRVRVTEIDPSGPTTLYIDWIPVRITYTPFPFLNQRSVIWQNDDGDADGNPLTGGFVNQNTTSTAPDTSLTMEKGERAVFRVQIDNTGSLSTTTVFNLQWATTTGVCTSSLTWQNVGTSSQISWAYGLSGNNDEALTTSTCAANSNTWTNGKWFEATSTTGLFDLATSTYTEFGFMVHTGNAATNTTYCLRLNNNGQAFNNYFKFGQLSILSSSTKRYSKNAVSSLPSTTTDLTYYLDNKGYSYINTDDGNRDQITSSSNIPVFLFAKKHTNNTDNIFVKWNGHSSTTNIVYLQVYNVASSTWETFATTTSTTTDFTLETAVTTSVSNYYDSNLWRYVRVYQDSGTQTLRTDYILISTVIFVSGNAYEDEGTTVWSGCGETANVSIYFAGETSTVSCSTSTGAFSFSLLISPPATGTPMVIWFDGVSGNYGSFINRYSGSGDVISTIVRRNRVILQHDDSGPITNSDLNTRDNDDDTDINYVVGINLIIETGSKLIVHPDTTFTPGGTVTIEADSNGDLLVMNGAVLNGSNNVTVKGGDVTGDGLISLSDGNYLINIKTISRGYYHTCAVSNAGNAYCWGAGINGQLGNASRNASTSQQTTPVRVHDGEATSSDSDGTYLINIETISAGGDSSYSHTCAVSNIGNSYCWGEMPVHLSKPLRSGFMMVRQPLQIVMEPI